MKQPQVDDEIVISRTPKRIKARTILDVDDNDPRGALYYDECEWCRCCRRCLSQHGYHTSRAVWAKMVARAKAKRAAERIAKAALKAARDRSRVTGRKPRAKGQGVP